MNTAIDYQHQNEKNNARRLSRARLQSSNSKDNYSEEQSQDDGAQPRRDNVVQMDKYRNRQKAAEDDETSDENKTSSPKSKLGFLAALTKISVLDDMPYVFAVLAGALEEALDFFIGWIPGVGVVISVCFTLFIGFMNHLASAKIKKKSTFGRTLGKLLILIGTGILGMIPIVNDFPWGDVAAFYLLAKGIQDRVSQKEDEQRVASLQESQS